MDVEDVRDALPHGSGIDDSWEIDHMGSYFRCYNGYHAMNEDGYYDGWADFSVIIPIKDPENFRLHFHGQRSQRLNRRYALREYLEDTIYWSLWDAKLHSKLRKR